MLLPSLFLSCSQVLEPAACERGRFYKNSTTRSHPGALEPEPGPHPPDSSDVRPQFKIIDLVPSGPFLHTSRNPNNRPRKAGFSDTFSF